MNKVKGKCIIPMTIILVIISSQLIENTSGVSKVKASKKYDSSSIILLSNESQESNDGGSIDQTMPAPPSEHETINNYVREISAKYNIDPELIMSIIQEESEYNPKATNGNCLGLMQMSSYWHAKRAIQLGVTNFYDAYSNILLGVDYISELITQYKDISLVLMLYNIDHATAFRLHAEGKVSSYAKEVMTRADGYKKGV